MRIENRADQQVIAEWIATFSSDELAANGWSSGDLLSITKDYSGLYLFSEDTLVASLIYQQVDKNHYEVLFLGTSPAHRRQGFQQGLLSHFNKLHPSSKLWLECRADNVAAIALYTKAGFATTGRRSKYYKDGTDAVLMELIFEFFNLMD